MYFKLVLDGGHAGAGKSHCMVRYFKAPDMDALFRKLHKLPRLKRKRSLTSVRKIEEISKDEYILGLNREKHDPYLNHSALAAS